MGIESFWFIEIFVEFRDRQSAHKEKEKKSKPLLILETLNCFHGLVHFYMFVITPKVMATIKRKVQIRSRRNLVQNTNDAGISNTGDAMTESSSNTKDSNLESTSNTSKF